MTEQEIEGQQPVVHDHVPHIRHEPDIPDLANKDVPKAQLTAEQALERNFRRYVRKDGLFIKDYQKIFDFLDRIDANNRMIYKSTKTLEEATKIIVGLCESTGRVVEKDPVTKRLKATPGWNLDITCPGMESVEQNAHVDPDNVVRQRRTDLMLQQSQEQVSTLTGQVKDLSEAVTKLLGKDEKSEGEKKADAEVKDAKKTGKKSK